MCSSKDIFILCCETACLRLQLFTSHACYLDSAERVWRALSMLLEGDVSIPVRIAALNEAARYFIAKYDYGNAERCFERVDDLLSRMPECRQYLRAALISPRVELLLAKEPMNAHDRAQAASLIGEYTALCRDNPNTYHLRHLERWLMRAQEQRLWLDSYLRGWQEPSETVFSSGYILTAWDQRGQQSKLKARTIERREP